VLFISACVNAFAKASLQVGRSNVIVWRLRLDIQYVLCVNCSEKENDCYRAISCCVNHEDVTGNVTYDDRSSDCFARSATATRGTTTRTGRICRIVTTTQCWDTIDAWGTPAYRLHGVSAITWRRDSAATGGISRKRSDPSDNENLSQTRATAMLRDFLWAAQTARTRNNALNRVSHFAILRDFLRAMEMIRICVSAWNPVFRFVRK